MKVKMLLCVGLVAMLLVGTAVTPAPAVAQQQIHVVQRGQTLTSIAARYGTTVQAIMRANGLSNPNFIYVGQRLRIPGSGSTPSGGGTSGVHVVRRGENLTQIARRYSTTVSAFVRTNSLRNANYIYVGQRLRIPGGAGGSGGGGQAPTSSTVHVVRRGETLQSIALRYKTTYASIATANGLRNPNLIYEGQRLRIPAGGVTVAPTSGGSKWIEIDLSSQTTIARLGNTIVRSMVVSTGIARYPTPPGQYRIYSKYPSVNMSGPGYYLPGVPHTMFFYRGYAIHGTYWHNNFGRPMSHGCINLTKADAAWLYSWAPVGTKVVIHW